MPDTILQILIALPAGVGIGFFYFGGLWMTLKYIVHSRRRILLTGASFLIRAVITCFAFYMISNGRWERLLGCLAGFLVARGILVSRLGPDNKKIRNPLKDSALR